MIRTTLLAAAAVALLSVNREAGAQTYYAPLQYEYRTINNEPIYYGGGDPLILDYAQRQQRFIRIGQRSPGAAPGQIYQRIPFERPLVFSDRLGYRDARAYGVTPDEARNEANASMPRYFSKAAALRDAVPTAEGLRVVPVTAGAARHDGRVRVSTPASEPTPLLVIPKPNAPTTAPSAIAQR